MSLSRVSEVAIDQGVRRLGSPYRSSGPPTRLVTTRWASESALFQLMATSSLVALVVVHLAVTGAGTAAALAVALVGALGCAWLVGRFRRTTAIVIEEGTVVALQRRAFGLRAKQITTRMPCSAIGRVEIAEEPILWGFLPTYGLEAHLRDGTRRTLASGLELPQAQVLRVELSTRLDQPPPQTGKVPELAAGGALR